MIDQTNVTRKEVTTLYMGKDLSTIFCLEAPEQFHPDLNYGLIAFHYGCNIRGKI